MWVLAGLSSGEYHSKNLVCYCNVKNLEILQSNSWKIMEIEKSSRSLTNPKEILKSLRETLKKSQKSPQHMIQNRKISSNNSLKNLTNSLDPQRSCKISKSWGVLDFFKMLKSVKISDKVWKIFEKAEMLFRPQNLVHSIFWRDFPLSLSFFRKHKIFPGIDVEEKNDFVQLAIFSYFIGSCSIFCVPPLPFLTENLMACENEQLYTLIADNPSDFHKKYPNLFYFQ